MPPTLDRRPRSLVYTLVLAVSFGACSAAASPAESAPAASEPLASAPATTPSTGTTEPDAWLVVGERGQPGLRVILASTREQLYQLPMGVPAERWQYVVSATTSGDATRVDELVIQPDLPTWRSRSIDGTWRLPRIGRDSLPVGVSADGSTMVLVQDAPRGDGTSARFAVLADNDPARVIELPGSLGFDALSPDGSILYVVEHLPAPPEGRYQVRAVDLPGGVMREAIIVDKRNLDATMGGWPITQAPHASGVVFTLYRGAMYPFIHALNTREAWAVCLVLPPIGHDDAEASLDWGIGQSADGRQVFAVNATLGLATAIDPGELSILHDVAFDAPRARATIELAKFGHRDEGPVGRRVVVSPDGSTVFAAGAGGIVRLETDRLTVGGRLLEGTAVDGLAMTPDGTTLFALTRDGRILRLDAATGAGIGQVPGEGYDRLVAIVPW